MELNAYLSTSTAPRHPPSLGWKGTVLQPSAPFSPKQVQEEKGEGQLLSSCSWLWLPAKVGKGEQ